jgi:hypothetical protein
MVRLAVAKGDIAARFPGYSVDGTITFSNYAPNAPVSPSVFVTPTVMTQSIPATKEDWGSEP